MFDGNVKSDVFAGWVEYDLLPSLPSKAVLVLDNAALHKRQYILDSIKLARHTVEFMPPYSPDLNEIEHKWAEAKAVRRKYGCDVTTIFTEYIH